MLAGSAMSRHKEALHGNVLFQRMRTLAESAALGGEDDATDAQECELCRWAGALHCPLGLHSRLLVVARATRSL